MATVCILIKKKNKENIYQLAKEVGRKYEAVYRDIRLLEDFGIVKVKGDKKKIPVLESLKIPAFAA